MPQPDVGDVHTNARLTSMSIAHMNDEAHFVADKVFPLVPSPKQSDLYTLYDRGDFFQGSENDLEMRNLIRAPGTRAPVAGYDVTTATFHCINFAVGVEIPDELRANADEIFELDNEGTLLVTQIQLIRRERAFATDFMVTSVWGTDVTGTTDFVKWSDYGGSDPITDIEDGMDTVEGATGRRPNKLVMGALPWRRLKHHPDFLDRINGGATPGQPATVTRELIAGILEIDEILVARASYRSSLEGVSLTMARIIDDDALLSFVAPRPGRMTPTAGVTFFWEPMTGGQVQFMRKYRQDPEKKDVLENHSYVDQVVTEAQSGYFFSDCVD